MKIDAHQHFWDYGADAADYGWMGQTDDALRRDFLPDDLAPLLAASGYAGCVAVQAREVEAETASLLRLARDARFVRGVVGWLDLCAPDVEARLDDRAGDPLLRGLRMAVHDRSDVGFASSTSHVHGVSRLGPRGLTYDLLVRSEHLSAAIVLVDACPDVRFVVDHLAKPRLDRSDWEPWSAGIAALARRPNVWCKLSGLGTLPGRGRPGPFLDAILAAFGPSRCMIGSDWPVSTLTSDYAATMGVVEGWCSALSAEERAMILGRTCATFYGLEANHG